LGASRREITWSRGSGVALGAGAALALAAGAGVALGAALAEATNEAATPVETSATSERRRNERITREFPI